MSIPITIAQNKVAREQVLQSLRSRGRATSAASVSDDWPGSDPGSARAVLRQLEREGVVRRALGALVEAYVLAEEAFTPGPWHSDPPTRERPSEAHVSALSGFVNIYSAPLTRETEANAALIAEAPAMLAALRRVVKDYEDNEDENTPVDVGCLDCTDGATPDRHNTGLCGYHAAKTILMRLAKGGVS
jgi:hypothetical protein